MLRFIALLVLAGCSTQTPVADTERSFRPVQAVPEPAPAPVVLPSYDESLDSPEEVAAWQADAIAKIDAYAALSDPEKIRARYAASFRLVAKVESQSVGDGRVWDAPAQKTRAEAVALEANDEEYEAGRAFVALGDTPSALRCKKELEDEQEWNAAGKLSFLAGEKIDPEKPISYSWTIDLSDVFLLAKVDRARALGFAETGLVKSSVNVVAQVYGGEGCSAGPVPGTLDLYQLVKSDPALKAAYLASVRGWTGGEGYYYVVNECSFADLGSLLARVRKLNDSDLTAAWDFGLVPSSVDDEGAVNGYRAILGLAPVAFGRDPLESGTLSAADTKRLSAEFKIGTAGTPDAIRVAIVKRIEARVSEAEAARNVARAAVDAALAVPDNVSFRNAVADKARANGSEAPRGVVPCRDDQIDAITAPVILELTSRAPGYSDTPAMGG